MIKRLYHFLRYSLRLDKRIKSVFYRFLVFKVKRRIIDDKKLLIEKENYVFSNRGLDFYALRPFPTFLKEIMLVNPGVSTTLNIGCNTGQIDYLIGKEFPNCKIYAVDINEKAIMYAKKNYSLKNISYFTFDALSESFVNYFSNKRIDLIFCFELIEHLFPSQMDTLFKNISNIAREDTIICFTTPYKHASDDGYHHVQFFTIESLEKRLSKRFKIERIVKFMYNKKLNKFHDIIFSICFKK